MPTGTMVAAPSIGDGGDAKLARAYQAFYRESQRARRPSRSALELALRCSNVAVWAYAGAQFVHGLH